MKTKLLIFLMLLGGICQAQEIPDTIFITDECGNRIDTLLFVCCDSAYVGDFIDTSYNYIEPYSITPLTLESLIDYQKECYNDSTLYRIAVMKRSKYQSSPSDNNMEIGYYKIPYPYRYDHVKPTFDGFIEYMKRKSR